MPEHNPAANIAIRTKYQETLNSVARSMGVTLTRLKWMLTESDHLTGKVSVNHNGQKDYSWLPELSLHLKLPEVVIMYSHWLSNLLRDRLNEFGASHVRGLDSRFTFGTHKGRTVQEVINDDSDYIEWALDNVDRFELDSAASDALDESLGHDDPLE